MKFKDNIYKNSDSRKSGEHLESLIIKYKPGGYTFKKASKEEDKKGTDLIDQEGTRYQVKHDKRIPDTGNLYIEAYEKSKPSDNWRKSPMNASFYISGYFKNTEHIIVYIISLRRIKNLIKEIGIPKETPTSKGNVIQLKNLENLRRYELPSKKKEHIISKRTMYLPSPLF